MIDERLEKEVVKKIMMQLETCKKANMRVTESFLIKSIIEHYRNFHNIKLEYKDVKRVIEQLKKEGLVYNPKPFLIEKV